MPSDDIAAAEQLRAVAHVARELGMRVLVLRVGDVVVQLAEPWGAPMHVAAKPDAYTAPEDEEGVRLQKLRDACKRNLGYVLPDEHLLKMGPAFGAA